MNEQKRYTAKVEQIAEIVPGIVTWLLILAPLWMSLISPVLAIVFITFLFVYIATITIQFMIGLFIGYFKYKRESKINWAARLKTIEFEGLPDPETLPKTKNKLPFFSIVIPSLKDPFSVVQDTLNAIAASKYPKENILVVLSLEDKNPEWAAEIKRETEKLFKDKFNLLVTIHKQEKEYPRAAGTNRLWAAKQAEKWLEDNSIALDSALLTTFDIDAILDPQFLPAIAYRYLTVSPRKQKFYTSAAFFFDNNIWQTHFFNRLQGTSTSINQLSYWVINSHMMETFSLFAINMEGMKAIGYWDPMFINDDAPTSLKLFFHFNGNFKGEAVFVPVHSDCVQGPTFWESNIQLYKQQMRWGWGGVEETKILLRGIYHKFNQIAPLTLISKTIFHFIRVNMLTSSLFLISFGISIIRVVNSDIDLSALVTNINNITRIVMGAIGLTAIPITLIRFDLFKKMPKAEKLSRKISYLFEMPLVIVNMFVFNMIPYIQAQTLPLINQRMRNFQSMQKQSRAK
jgi:cellulose synthase/poly-beta-1,6-N-acetylglucosamine synthase-like glycosyltransferase